MTRTAVETVFLDAGGVLIEPDWGRVAAVLAREGVPADPARLAAVDPLAKREADDARHIRATDDRARGTGHTRRLLRLAGVEAPEARVEAACAAVAAAHARENLWSAVPPGVPVTLERLRAAGMGLVVVSNADGRLRGHMERCGLAPLVDHLLDSGALGFEKPDPRIFREALRVSGARAETTVHVGDYYEIDVVGARAAGLRAALLDPAGLHADRDCPRYSDLASFADALLRGGFPG